MTALACPACRKINPEGVVCERCGADLALLRKVRTAAEETLDRAEAALRQGDFMGAEALGRRSFGLKRSAGAAKLIFLSLVSRGDFDRGRIWFRHLLEDGERAEG